MLKIGILAMVAAGVFSFQAFASAPPADSPALRARAKAEFSANCMNCHGVLGDGNGPMGRYMTPKPGNWVKGKYKRGSTVADFFKIITFGIDKSAMPAFATLISEQDRWALAYYVFSFKKGK